MGETLHFYIWYLKYVSKNKDNNDCAVNYPLKVTMAVAGRTLPGHVLEEALSAS